MKRKLLLMLIAILLSNIAFTQVIDESFEAWPPTSWTLDPSTGDGTWVQDDGSSYGPGATNIYDGFYAAMFNNYSYSSGTTGSMITPVFDVTGVMNPTLSFYWWNNDGSSTPATLDVYSTIDGTTWDLIESIDTYGSGTTTWVLFSRIIANNVIQIKLTATSDWGMKNTFVDKFVIEGVSCLAPTDQVETNITSSGADLGWTDGSGSYWDLYIVPAGDIPPNQGSTPTVDNTQSNAYTWSGGTSGTAYDWYVRSDCEQNNTGTSSWTGPNTFATLCDPFTATLSENFDATPVGEVPTCWTSIVDASSSYAEVDAYSYNYPHSGSRHIRMYNSYDVSATLILATPQFSDLTTQANQIRFWAKSNSSGYDLEIGTMSDPTDETTYTEFRTITLTDIYTEYVVAFDAGYTATDEYVAFKHGLGGTYRSLYIDDFIYEPIPACPSPSDLVVTEKRATSARLSWVAGSGVSGYNWQVVPEGNDPDDNPVAQGSVFGDTTDVANGLEASTTYDAYVQSDCSGGPRDAGWIGPVTFTTACNTVTTFPLSQGFENGGNIPMCWSTEFVSGSLDWTFEDGGHGGHPDHAAKGGYNALFFVDDYSHPVTRLVSPSLDLTGATSPYLTFLHTQAKWYSDQDELRVYYKTSVNGTWTLIPGAEWTDDIPDWKAEIITLPNPSADYYIAFEATANYGYGVAIDQVQMGPVAPVPVSDWAIVIGVFFILTFLVVTYKRRFA